MPSADQPVAANDGCDISQPGYFTATRFGTCLNGMEITYTLVNDKGAVVGTGLMNVATSMTLSATKTTWNETATVKVIGVIGQVKSLNISYDVGCTGGCSMTDARPWDGTKTLGVGGTATGTLTYSTPLASGGLTNVTSKHHMYVISSGAIPVQPNVSWDNPWPIRCDNQVGANPGCVVPDVRANFEFSLAEFGGAAATYGWAQNGACVCSCFGRAADGVAGVRRQVRAASTGLLRRGRVVEDRGAAASVCTRPSLMSRSSAGEAAVIGAAGVCVRARVDAGASSARSWRAVQGTGV
ncbi:hypothetical protein [Streptomyces milbemycinicus]|uniref:hypothetical protein n=1 Tax=Streptomyces milbemycinicus TaxID=476552 RepID=UPI0033F85E4F